MLRIFRNIRREMMDENKMGRYAVYALGEVVLVVIGILIALQLNNWNEQRKKKEELHTYVATLIEDVQSAMNLETRIEVNLGVIRHVYNWNDGHSSILDRYRARAINMGEQRGMRYDLRKMKDSEEFILCVQNTLVNLYSEKGLPRYYHNILEELTDFRNILIDNQSRMEGKSSGNEGDD